MPVHLDAVRYEWDETAAVLSDSLPVLPGNSHTVQVTYIMSLDEQLQVALPLDYPLTGAAELMLPPGAFEVESAQFVLQGIMQFSAGTFEDYLSQPLAAGETLAYTLTARAPAPEPEQSLLGVMLVAVGGLLLLSAGGLWVMQRRSVSADQLLAQITELDQAHAAGQVNDEAAYRKRRQQLKNKLSQRVKDE